MHLQTLTIVGVGLIGGSIGLAAKKRMSASVVRGVGRQRKSLEAALDKGCIDEVHLDLAKAAKDSNLIIFCTPVDKIATQVLGAAGHCAPGTLLTDAGSTKAKIVAAIEGKLPAGVSFVGSHPLAGSEKRGPQHADGDLFEGRWVVLTRTPNTDQTALEKILKFWQALGCKTSIMTPAEHDRALALTSHLPHLLASALAGVVPSSLLYLAASGFRDTTRIAGGDPALWSAICAENRSDILHALKQYEAKLAEFRKAIKLADWAEVESLLTHAKKVRDALGN